MLQHYGYAARICISKRSLFRTEYFWYMAEIKQLDDAHISCMVVVQNIHSLFAFRNLQNNKYLVQCTSIYFSLACKSLCMCREIYVQQLYHENVIEPTLHFLG